MLKLSRVLFSLIFLVVLYTQFAISQTHPSTDIFLADMKIENNKFIFSNVVNITDRDGYDDQPFFTPYESRTYVNRILYTSIREGGQADTYSYDLIKKTISCVNHTPEASEYYPSEYPTYMDYSVLRVEKDGTRYLCSMRYNEPGYYWIDPDKRNVGAHLDVGEDIEAFSVLADPDSGTPSELKIIFYRLKEVITIAENVGSCLKKGPGSSTVSFVHKVSNDNWLIKKYKILWDPNKIYTITGGELTTLTSTLPGSEEFCIVPGNDLLMGSGSKLYNFDISSDNKWHEIADFSAEGIKYITRLAVSPGYNRIAIVTVR